ncbi:MAG TPA: DUF928 domain-containing protein [Methylomirabilota bacterium]|jgi:hypothetical protein
MTHGKLATLLALAALLAGYPSAARAGEDGRRLRPQPAPEIRLAQATTSVPVYKPPLRGAPGGRVGGGTRGAGRELFVLTVLAPDHTGLTVQEQPSLRWFVSNKTPYPVEFTVMDPRATQPLVEHRIPAPIEAGLHTIRLADHNVRLAPGVAYRWFVAIVPDASRRSRDILAGGTIERVEPSEELRAKLARASKADVPFVYAEAGVWYDAFTAISELIDTSPGNADLKKQRAALMSQVGLPEIND